MLAFFAVLTSFLSPIFSAYFPLALRLSLRRVVPVSPVPHKVAFYNDRIIAFRQPSKAVTAGGFLNKTTGVWCGGGGGLGGGSKRNTQRLLPREKGKGETGQNGIRKGAT